MKNELDEEIKVQLDNTRINEERSNYVTALIHYDNYKFDNNLNESFLSQNYFNFYHSVFHNIFKPNFSHKISEEISQNDTFDTKNTSTDPKISSNDTKISSTDVDNSSIDPLNSTIDPLNTTIDLPNRSTEDTTGTVEYITEEEISENNNCDVCYTKLNSSVQSVSTCKYCNIKSHTYCLLNFTNIITHLTPLHTIPISTVNSNSVGNSNSIEDPDYSPVSYEYICKICYNRKNKKKNSVKRVRCVICNSYNGIINSGDVFYHPFCALYCYEQVSKFFTTSLMFNSTEFTNSNEVSSNLSEFNKFLLLNNENNAKLRLQCGICDDSEGVLLRCSGENCPVFLHPRCVITNKHKKKRHGIVYKYFNINFHTTQVSSSSTQGINSITQGISSSSVVLFKGIFCSRHNNKVNINSVIDKFIHTRPYEFTHFVPHTPKPNSIPLNLQIPGNSGINRVVDRVGDGVDKRKLMESVESSSVKKIRHTEGDSISGGHVTSEESPPKTTQSGQELKTDTPNTNTLNNMVNNTAVTSNKVNSSTVSGLSDNVVPSDGVDEMELKVQKVLWNKLDIFNGNDPRLEGDLISQMISSVKRQSLLPLNSMLFDNIFSVEELNYCFQQQLLHNCSNIISLLKFITVNSRNRVDHCIPVDQCLLPLEDQDDKFVYILFENNINNCVMIYQIVPPEEDVSSNLVLNQINGLTDLCYVDRFNDVYNIYDDIKYLTNNSNFSNNSDFINNSQFNTNSQFNNEGSGDGSALGLRLVKSIFLSHFESEILKRSIMQLTHYNVSLLLVNSGNCVSVGATGTGANGMHVKPPEVIGLNSINWNKIINFNIPNVESPIKYSEFSSVNGASTDSVAKQMTRVDEKVLVNEFKLINSEIHHLNNELLMLKRSLTNNILNDITLNMSQSSNQSLQTTINKYNKNEYNYYLLHSLKKLFSDGIGSLGQGNKLPSPRDTTELTSTHPRQLGTQSNVHTTHSNIHSTPSNVHTTPSNVNPMTSNLYSIKPSVYDLEDVDLIKRCQICFNVEESNINTLFKCVRCLVYVHKYCYNVYRKSSSEYLCNRCEHEKKQNQITFKKFSLLCNLCKRGSGVFIKISDYWFHNFCLILHYYSQNQHNSISKFNTMKYYNTIDNLECVVCRLKIGIMLSCFGCGVKFHAYCGYFQGFHFTINNSIIINCNNCYNSVNNSVNSSVNSVDSSVNNLIGRWCNYLNRDIISDKKRPTRVDFSSMKPSVQMPECSICHSVSCGTFTKSVKCPGCEINCVNCGIILHRHCYPFKLGNSFKCVKCVTGSTNLRCFICHHSDDILIKQQNYYYHIICYTLHNNQSTLSSFNSNNNSIGNSSSVRGIGENCLETRHGNKNPCEITCCLCLERDGLMIKCFRKNCLNRFHPNCALKNKLVLDFYTPTDYIALCQEHSLLHNAVGPNLKFLIKMRLQILMMRDLFKDMYHQNAVLCSIIRKRKEIHNQLYPLI